MQSNATLTPSVTRSVLREFDTPRILSLEQIEAFREDGFIRLKNVFSEQALHQCEQIMTQAVEQRAAQLPPLDQRGTYGKAFIQVVNLWLRHQRVQQLVFSRLLNSIVTELLGIRRIRLYHDHALYKEANGGITPWHVDQRYWPLKTSLTMTVWIPLQPTPQSMGTLEYAAGSHRLFEGRNLPISDESEEQIARLLQNNDTKLVNGDFELGEVSFHYGWTYHRASANLSNQTRKALSIMYFADGSKIKVFENQAQESDARTFLQNAQPGDDAISDITPLLAANQYAQWRSPS